MRTRTPRTPRTERRQDRTSGATVCTRIPLADYLFISNLLAAQGSNVTRWLRGLALNDIAAKRPQAITIAEELDRR